MTVLCTLNVNARNTLNTVQLLRGEIEKQFELTHLNPPQVSGLSLSSKNHSPDPWISADKFEHFFISAMLSGGGLLVLKMNNNRENQSLIACVGVTICLGASKEFYDKTSGKGTASWKDFTAGVVGAVFGALIAQSL